MIRITVALMSGRAVDLEVVRNIPLGELSRRAQFLLGVRGRLLSPDGGDLHGDTTLVQAGVQSGDILTLHTRPVYLAAADSAFSAILSDGTIVSWGYPGNGGDCRSASAHLRNVQEVQASQFAFAALRGDGSVVTWGNSACGGNCSKVACQLKQVREVQDLLQDVREIQASEAAFAAILANGEVVTWGWAGYGGDSQAVHGQLKDVQRIQAAQNAFAAISKDGSVVTWGNPSRGGDSRSVLEQLSRVTQIQASESAFAALREDGSVVTWGHDGYGADSSAIRYQLVDVREIQATASAFAALRHDGSVVTWGNPENGGCSEEVKSELTDVHAIQATNFAFAAVRTDGSVVTWGNPSRGGDSKDVHEQLQHVQQIQASAGAFAAILADESVVTWGHSSCGGDSTSVRKQLNNVQQVQASRFAFAAVLDDASVVTWGAAGGGGDSSAVREAKAKQKRLEIRSEIDIMKLTDHPNVVKLHETFEDRSQMYLVMELCAGGDLDKHMKGQGGPYSEHQAAILMDQILKAVSYLHDCKSICHRDLKLQNFLFSRKAPVENNVLKLADFGLACSFEPGGVLATKAGTVSYCSPQVLGGVYDNSADLWSCGVIMYMLLAAQPPFSGKNDAEVAQRVRKGNYVFSDIAWSAVSEEAKNLVRKLLKYQPFDRATAVQARSHAWFLYAAPFLRHAIPVQPSVVSDLLRFSRKTTFQRAALRALAMQLGQEAVDRCSQDFAALDYKGMSFLSLQDLEDRLQL
ncbi:CPK2 [Symbiodinium sp. KB8]|nr:CPK2 [Symbiodinium sp. KB8]